jgi:hypothetical protein
MRISENVAQEFVNALLASPVLEDPSISFELQDDWQFLLVVVKVSALESRDQIVSFLKKAQETAEKGLPWRRGDYSWMVNVIKDGMVVESVFGGDLNSPSSGRL